MSTKMSKKKHRKEDRVEEGLNSNRIPIAWTRLNIAFIQLTFRRHVAVGKHGCSWNDRR